MDKEIGKGNENTKYPKRACMLCVGKKLRVKLSENLHNRGNIKKRKEKENKNKRPLRV